MALVSLPGGGAYGRSALVEDWLLIATSDPNQSRIACNEVGRHPSGSCIRQGQ